jgi:hypothetical protein
VPDWIIVFAPSLVVGFVSGVVLGRMTYRRIKKVTEIFDAEIDLLSIRLQNLENGTGSLKYRMDVFEGKHLRARNLGLGLPQPRPREKNGD